MDVWRKDFVIDATAEVENARIPNIVVILRSPNILLDVNEIRKSLAEPISDRYADAYRLGKIRRFVGIGQKTRSEIDVNRPSMHLLFWHFEPTTHHLFGTFIENALFCGEGIELDFSSSHGTRLRSAIFIIYYICIDLRYFSARIRTASHLRARIRTASHLRDLTPCQKRIEQCPTNDDGADQNRSFMPCRRQKRRDIALFHGLYHSENSSVTVVRYWMMTSGMPSKAGTAINSDSGAITMPKLRCGLST